MYFLIYITLTLIWVGFLEVRFEVGGWWWGITPSPSNLALSTNIHVVSENIPLK